MLCRKVLLNDFSNIPFRVPEKPRRLNISGCKGEVFSASHPGRFYLDVDGFINLDSFAENVNPLAQIGKLPHVAYATEHF